MAANHCSMKDLIEKKGYSNAEGYKPEPDPKEDLENNWRKDGTGAYACCLRRTPWGTYIADWHYYNCKDGGWQPYYPTKYNKCR
ncbi:unnamed protein product [Heligmosomoides polygyrus]|uniref:Kringle domain-containing protein n=1 Tax=Heligmosomoides polygyrus TaxID=6339 RepID=A0A183FV87_HELPZ|nr:unnamed protein product [Heligmosomoides polygyrus]